MFVVLIENINHLSHIQVSWLSSPKDCVFPETIPEEASSIEEERVVIFRLPAASKNIDPSFYTVCIFIGFRLFIYAHQCLMLNDL